MSVKPLRERVTCAYLSRGRSFDITGTLDDEKNGLRPKTSLSPWVFFSDFMGRYECAGPPLTLALSPKGRG